MRAALFKTIRESIGLEINDLAKLCNVDERTVCDWESGATAIPDDVVKWIDGIDQQFTNATAQSLAFVRELSAANGAPAKMALVRYRDDATLWRFRSDMRPLPAGAHAALLARVRLALLAEGVAIDIVYMDVDRYIEWLDGRADSEPMRGAWAGLVSHADEAPREPS